MGDRPQQNSLVTTRCSPPMQGRWPDAAWRLAAGLGLLLALSALAARLARGPAMDEFLILSSGVSSALLCLSLIVRNGSAPVSSAPVSSVPVSSAPEEFELSFRNSRQGAALDRMKDEFISTVSHELRTPLTSIRGALGMLSSGIHGEMSDTANHLLRIALANSDRMVRLVNDILDLERIQSGRVPLTFRRVQLGELVSQAIDGMQPVADEAGVLLLHGSTQVEIAADPDRLLQVITNLLSNAVKFSLPASIVYVAIETAADGVTVSVIDRGRGVPADKLDAIFGRFEQVDESDFRQKGGSGLGLAICRTIVQQHSGRIWAERNPVSGSTFRVFLPWQPARVEGTILGIGSATGIGSALGWSAGEVKAGEVKE